MRFDYYELPETIPQCPSSEQIIACERCGIPTTPDRTRSKNARKCLDCNEVLKEESRLEQQWRQKERYNNDPEYRVKVRTRQNKGGLQTVKSLTDEEREQLKAILNRGVA